MTGQPPSMRFTLPVLICFLVAPVSAHAEALPPVVQAAIKESVDTCKPDKAMLGKGFVSRKDVNGDGVLDIILDYASFRCGDNASYFCGSAGCTTQVFASVDGGGYVKVLDENVHRLTFKRVRGRPAMLLGLHGSACGRPGVQPCGTTLYWNGSKFSPAN